MSVKANLRVVLLANEVTVAESIDAALWQSTLARITGRQESPTGVPDGQVETPSDTMRTDGNRQFESEVTESATCVFQHFSEELQLDSLAVQGACDPSLESPYIHLDVRAWQEFRRNTAARGSTSIPPIVLAATLLVLWFRDKRLGAATISQAQAVLNTIDTRDKNPARGLRNCDWLQTREDVIKLNPSRFDQATAVARAYCNRQPIEET